ncbi:TIGR04282 family arsenosugar biosynthesis glycosyltransferase [Rubritalea sp.]|uniref:TIGR04282 family arsenosugar biosynthesis glycosyltransferase n=1 Tax=Rubritalea sp. TaxID=2109375 RepID=UPI003EF8DFAD
MNALLIFLKEPIAGKVKTRLAASTGDDEAARRYKAMVNVLLEQLEGLSNTHVRFCHTPDDSGEAVTFWLLPELRGEVIKRSSDFIFTPKKNAPPFTIDFKPQGDGDLGEKLQRATNQAFSEGYKKVAVIGSNCIHCGARWINAAFLQTKTNTCVIGPNESNGFYLISTAKAAPKFFDGIPWNSSETLEATKKAIKDASLELIKLPPLVHIHDEQNWDSVMESAIGGKLKAALKKVNP